MTLSGLERVFNELPGEDGDSVAQPCRARHHRVSRKGDPMTAIARLARATACIFACLFAVATGPAMAQDGPFAPGWQLDPAASALRFQSVKNGDKVELSEFATFSGTIAPDGTAEIRVAMDSVDTGIDLRNVRMRFLFFETFLFPEAVITATIDPAIIDQVRTSRRMTLDMPVTLTLHGVTRDLVAPVSVTLITDDLVAVTSSGPILIPAADFGLAEGIAKLEEAANVDIVPSGTVTFDFLFARSGIPSTPAEDPPAAEAATTSAALEPQGAFDAEACLGRFEILSRSGNIYFRSGSATLDPASEPLLATLLDIVNRCPGMKIEVGGHTDSDGSEAENLRLSDRRALAVAEWLVAQGADRTRLVTRGYGETAPVVANDTPENKSRNRRIEFLVIPG
jgi:outer membrane protein OmpA-like peptidoglycan-associated protein/polyisoprenoid-binding protein YceI